MTKDLYYPNKEERLKELKQISEPMFDAHREVIERLNLPHNRKSREGVREPIKFLNPSISWLVANNII